MHSPARPVARTRNNRGSIIDFNNEASSAKASRDDSLRVYNSASNNRSTIMYEKLHGNACPSYLKAEIWRLIDVKGVKITTRKLCRYNFLAAHVAAGWKSTLIRVAARITDCFCAAMVWRWSNERNSRETRTVFPVIPRAFVHEQSFLKHSPRYDYRLPHLSRLFFLSSRNADDSFNWTSFRSLITARVG